MSFKNIDAIEFSELVNQEGSIVLDVRSEGEAAQGSIPGSMLINIMSPSFSLEIEKLDKSKVYLIYCQSGNRSSSACGYMSSLGFENLHNLSGGILSWNRISLPT